ncbi:MAG TPA: ATP-dependent DNA helicase RecQ [Gemmatimonadales bacterium]|nr:ATP-dependent DNA helicase RecQ [Gemmatimonadales bacterium]
MSTLPARLAEARRQLHGSYGFRDFRPLQRRVVQSVLAGRDTLAVLPTGGGKSICFQVPALVLGGLTIVISPLVALMQDQIAALKARGIPADALNSLMPYEAQQAVRARIADRSLRLLYLSPERAERTVQELAAASIRPALLAVDEAHCISEWGHDFRPSYRHLGRFRDALGAPPTIALTGSATPAVREDILQSLGLRRPDLHLGSFDRPNLTFGVVPLRNRRDRVPLLLDLLARHPGLAIVYVATRNTADALAQRLERAGRRAMAYHAGLTRERRHEVLQRFLAEDLDVVTATSAFGMGIDAPRVRLVAHWGMPATPEAYYQEAGRAGRDGQPSTCLLLRHRSDAGIHRRQLDVTFPPRQTLEEIWNHPDRRRRHPAAVVASADRLAEELAPGSKPVDWSRIDRRKRAALGRLHVMEQYASGHRCRRQVLLRYFGEEAGPCAGCDACSDRRPFRRIRSAIAMVRDRSG